MKKKLKFLIPLLLVALILVGGSCGQDSNDPGGETEESYTTYSNEKWKLEFKHPEEWYLEFENDSDIGLTLALNAPKSADAEESNAGFLVVAYVPEKEQVFNQEIEKSISQLEASQILIAQSEKTIAGRNGYELIYVDNPSTPKTKQLHYFIDGGDVWYQLLYMAEVDSYENWLEEVRGMVNSFKITN